MRSIGNLSDEAQARRGTFLFALLVAVTGVGPMLAQYWVSGPGYVGGMSGVVYGLAGYIWMGANTTWHPAFIWTGKPSSGC